MLGWAAAAGICVPLGWVVLRAWRQDAAIKSGEVMDVRGLMPDGQGDCLVRVLGERRYRVELQVEASHLDGARLPLRLTLTRISDAGEEEEVVYDGMRSLVELAPLGSGRETGADGSTQFWGSLPLLELSSASIARLRFEAWLPPTEDAGGREIGRIDKASLVVKENVRPWVASASLLEHVVVEDPHRV